MPHFPILRWGEPYESLDVDPVVHFATGEPLCEVSQANPGLVSRDMQRASEARRALLQFSPVELCGMLSKAADVFLNGSLPLGDTKQSASDFVRCQSATTGLPEHMCRLNMEKLHHVLVNLDAILNSLTRGLDRSILAKGYGTEGTVMRSMQANSPVLGMVLPSNSPGTHGLWLPVLALQIGLVLKPGSLEPWTPFRLAQAFFEAGIPRETISLYPGQGIDVGMAVVEHVDRCMIFGSKVTIDQHRGNPAIQVHGPGFSKIILGDDCVDDWENYLDLMVESIAINAGRSCINCSGIWASRHTREIADALAQRLASIAPLPPDDPKAQLAAFTIPSQAEGTNTLIEQGLRESGVEEVTSRYRDGDRFISESRCAYLRPTIVHCDSPNRTLANTEYMFPFASVVECPQDAMLAAIGDTLVGTVVSEDADFRTAAAEATNIDRLNIGPIPTPRLNWLQPHEGNIISFLFRERALQVDDANHA